MVTNNDSEDKASRSSVVLKVKCPSEKDTATLTLQFRYIEDLDVVTVASEDVLLKNLFQQDGGSDIPNKAVAKPASLSQMKGEPFKYATQNETPSLSFVSKQSCPSPALGTLEKNKVYHEYVYDRLQVVPTPSRNGLYSPIALQFIRRSPVFHAQGWRARTGTDHPPEDKRQIRE